MTLTECPFPIMYVDSCRSFVGPERPAGAGYAASHIAPATPNHRTTEAALAIVSRN
jgi:hypothetical protein